MPNSIITAAGLALFADALYSGETITIDRLVFADVPGLDPAVTPDENQSLPPAGQIMLNAEISHSGKVDENTVVYSTILTANDGNFYINWIGLYSTEHETLVAVCVVPRHYKFKTDGFQAGNTLFTNNVNNNLKTKTLPGTNGVVEGSSAGIEILSSGCF